MPLENNAHIENPDAKIPSKDALTLKKKVHRKNPDAKTSNKNALTLEEKSKITAAIYKATKQDRYGFALRSQINLIDNQLKSPQYKKSQYIDFANKDGQTPLLLAVQDENLDAVKLLIKEGASVNRGNIWHGYSPLHKATENENLEIVQVLLNANANPNLKNKDGNTPLHKATENENLEIVQALLNANANPNLKDKDGNTPLHYAAALGNLEITTALINAGCNLRLKNNYEWTLLDAANSSQNKDVINLINRKIIEIERSEIAKQEHEGKIANDIKEETPPNTPPKSPILQEPPSSLDGRQTQKCCNIL